MLDVHGKSVNQTCYVLLSQAIFQAGIKTDVPGADVWEDWYSLGPNPFTLWCSSNESHLGPGWLPLPMDTAYSLLNGLGTADGQDALPDLKNFTYTAGHASGNGDTVPDCPVHKGFERLANTSLTRQAEIMAFPLLANPTNPWKIPDVHAILKWESLSKNTTGTPAVENDYSVFGDRYNAVQQDVINYLTILGWEGKGAGLPCQTQAGYNYPGCQYHKDINISVGRPLSRAFPYAALRYQCSGADQGVLCDYSAWPPLAVDVLGNPLTKKTLFAQPDWILYDIAPTSVWVEWAVAAMLIVTVVSNLGSLVFLGYPFLGRLLHVIAAHARQVAQGAVQHVKDLHDTYFRRRG